MQENPPVTAHLKQVDEWEREDKELEIQEQQERVRYVKSLSKSELQQQLLDALEELDNIRNRY